MNSLSNDGVKILSDVIARTHSLVSLNLGSNDISSEGMCCIFDAMALNQSVVCLDLSTVDCSNRNRMNKKCMQSFKRMLIQNEMVDNLSLNAVNMGNFGMNAIGKALNYQLDQAIRQEKEKESRKVGEFIRSGGKDEKSKDYSVLPQLRETEESKVRKSLSKVNVTILKISNNDICDPLIFEEIKIGLNFSNLKEIDLSENPIGDASISAICRSLNQNCCIEKINLTNVKMTWKGAKDLFLSVLRYSTMKELTLDRNALDGSKLKILKEMVSNNRGLNILNMN